MVLLVVPVPFALPGGCGDGHQQHFVAGVCVPTSRCFLCWFVFLSKSLEEKQILRYFDSLGRYQTATDLASSQVPLGLGQNRNMPSLKIENIPSNCFFLFQSWLDALKESHWILIRKKLTSYFKYMYIYIYILCEFVARAFWGSTFSLPHLSTQPSSTTSYHCLNYLNFIWMESEHAKLWNIVFSWFFTDCAGTRLVWMSTPIRTPSLARASLSLDRWRFDDLTPESRLAEVCT